MAGALAVYRGRRRPPGSPGPGRARARVVPAVDTAEARWVLQTDQCGRYQSGSAEKLPRRR